jgi:hypothetical protein
MEAVLQSGAEAAAEHAECCICFDELWKQPTCVFIDRGTKRTCEHFFHHECVKSLHPKKCPICRAPFHGTLPVPDIDASPNAWFSLVDFDGSGSLDKKEVLEVLKAQLPVDWRRLEENLDGMWQQWDADGSGALQHAELMHPTAGLVAFVRSAFAYDGSREVPAPDLRTHALAWFDHFDEDRGGSLDKGEVVRAVIKTFGLVGDSAQITSMREMLDAVWCIFDDDGSGVIERDEFTRKDGLADTILATQ